MSVAVHVLGGFLGAGKTSALVSLLDGALAGERVAVVVNDFGESAVDEATVGARPIAVEEIRGSCVCCTAPEGFVGAVGRLLQEHRPDRILVEPTGLARAADLIDTLRRAPYAEQLDLRPLIVLVDPATLEGPHGRQVREHARTGDVLVANRTDQCTPAQLADFDRWVSELWPAPVSVHKTVRGVLPAAVLDWPAGTGPRAPQGGHGHGHLDGWRAETWTWPPDAVFSRRRLLAELDVLADLPGIARLKGLFRTDEGWSRIELAGGQRNEAPTPFRRDSRVDVIGTDFDSDAVLGALRDTVLGAADLQAAAESLEIGGLDGATRRFDRASLQGLVGGVDDVSAMLPGREGSAARLGALMDHMALPAGAHAVVVAADGYTTPPVPADALRTALLIHSLNGDPLPRSKGGPLRLMIPGDAGPGGPCANVKGVVRIAFRR